MLLYVDRQDGCVVIELRFYSVFLSPQFLAPPSPPTDSVRKGEVEWSVLEKAEY